ncbi:Lrp/AsnC family transcriptional regulator [Shewanella sp. A3A]|uniref:Lrp/AsnC family transcriptional regulator n=1 Tax=Shewanella electrica TaxID=515560 RepID=A0ABT2FN55_9GAMM|nr:Lrp/AsnC family transcriptional regulator [Shewanella electrica]MCH1919568.1 Lrp/AsnC family transcriptional regulator [Shewanella ferrihydritica]MCH1926260.1 Lrp/AsnC family transcriptional regulator [Shewanella electrica]MCS4557772.1 Lrp/AsnC family transcriptional regulator [Shewanella electrica]
MDKFDQAIIAALRQNARMSVSAIAEQINLSRSAVSERLKKLEQTKVIRGYQVLTSEAEKQAVSAYFEVHHQAKSCAELVDFFRAIPEIITCHGISGDMDLLIYVNVPTMQRLHKVREAIDAHPAVSKIKTHVVMSEWINNLPVQA